MFIRAINVEFVLHMQISIITIFNTQLANLSANDGMITRIFLPNSHCTHLYQSLLRFVYLRCLMFSILFIHILDVIYFQSIFIYYYFFCTASH